MYNAYTFLQTSNDSKNNSFDLCKILEKLIIHIKSTCISLKSSVLFLDIK